MITENIPERSGFSLPRAFHPWSWIHLSPSGLLENYFFVCVYWVSTPAVAQCWPFFGQFKPKLANFGQLLALRVIFV